MSGFAGAPATELRSVSTTEHELRFAVEIAGSARELWIRSSTAIAAPNEAAAIATLLPALAVGSPLRIEVPVAGAVIDAMNEAQAVLCSWARSGAWPAALPFDRPIEIAAPVGDPGRLGAGAGTAAFFSGGVDSFATVLRHPEITHLVQIEGFDVPLERTDVASQVRSRLVAAAADLGKELIVVRMSIRELSDPYVAWVTYYGAALGTIAMLLSGSMSRVMIGTGMVYDTLYENGSHPLLDHLWGADRVEIVHDGAGLNRIAKLELLAAEPVAREALRVCWQNPGGAYNCGRCEKCLRTMVPLEVLGVRERFETFPEELDLNAVAAVELGNRPEVDFWVDNLELAVREGADPRLIEALEACLATGRSGPGTPRAASRAEEPEQGDSGLYMHPEARRKLANASAVTFLVGSYEGWGNYGDLAQLRSALDLLAAELPHAVACPVLSLHGAAGHLARAADGDAFGDHTPFYFAAANPETDRLVCELGLVPAVLPGPIPIAAWLYGGGYLNPRWGIAKLQMVEAARAIGRRAGAAECPLVSSGLQIDPAWMRGLDDRFLEPLGELRLLGVRDELSAQALVALPGSETRVVRTGDDAIGVLKLVTDRAATEDRGATTAVNLHFCDGEWVSDDPEAMRAWIGDLVVEVAGAVAGRIRIQPLIAYEDPRMSERRALDLLTGAIAPRLPGVAVAEPLVLTPGTILEAAPTMAAARITVSSSYHVALTSLWLGVPAVLPRANGYYAQKADALRRLFDLPAAAFPDPREDAGSAARRVIEALGVAGGGARPELGAARTRALERRVEAEAALAAELAAALPSSVPAHAGASVAITATEREALLGGLERAYARIDALTVQAAWQEARLDDIGHSASWRITAPIRAAKAMLRGGREAGSG